MIEALPIRKRSSLARDTFQLHGKRYFVTKSGWETLRLIERIDLMASNTESGSWALRARPVLKEIVKLHSPRAVSLVILHAPTKQQRIIALWARGHLRGSVGTRVVSKFLYHPSGEVRKAAIRAMKRMNGHAQLEGVRQHDSSARLRRIATIRPIGSPQERLSRFTNCISKCETSAQTQPLFVDRSVELFERTPPKKNSFIRKILNRIRQLMERDRRPWPS